MIVTADKKQLQAVLKTISEALTQAGFAQFTEGSECVITASKKNGRALKIEAGAYGLFVRGFPEATCEETGQVTVNGAHFGSLKLPGNEVLLQYKKGKLKFQSGRMRGDVATTGDATPDVAPVIKVPITARVPRAELVAAIDAVSFKPPHSGSSVTHAHIKIAGSTIEASAHDNFIGCYYEAELEEGIKVKKPVKFVAATNFLLAMLNKDRFTDDYVDIGAVEETFRIKDSHLDLYYPAKQMEEEDVKGIINQHLEQQPTVRIGFDTEAAANAIASVKSIAETESKQSLFTMTINANRKIATCAATSTVGTARNFFDLSLVEIRAKRPTSVVKLLFNSEYTQQILKMVGKGTATMSVYAKRSLVILGNEWAKYMLPEAQA